MSSGTEGERFVYFFGAGEADGGSEVRHLVGGKGASLGDMTRAGLNVPPGFTISAACCAHYWSAGKKWPEGLEAEVHAGLARLEKLVGRPFGRSANPLLVSVRSGAAESMPGMMDTLLNVGLNPDCVRAMAERTGDPRASWGAYRHFLAMFGQIAGRISENVFTDVIARMLQDLSKGGQEELDGGQMEQLCNRLRTTYRQATGRDVPTQPWELLRAAIDVVFESWNSERALAYRRHHQIHGLLGTAVTVQTMCPAEVSGVMFTANPVNPALEQIVIESCCGLGEAIVLGKVTPDRFVLDKHDLQLVEREIADRESTSARPGVGGQRQTMAKEAASLSADQIAELGRLGLQIEALFQGPCDIEWALSSGRFFLLQARPMQGLEDGRLIEQVRREQIERLRQLAGGRRCAWVIHNLAETLPSPTPMTWDVMRRFMSGAGGYGLMYQDLGFEPSERVKREGFLDLVCGRVFLNTQRHAEFFWSDFPWDYDIDLIKQNPARAEAMPTKIDPARAGLSLMLKLPRLWGAMRRSRKRIHQLKQDYDRCFQEKLLPAYLQYVQEQRCQDLTRLEDAALVHEFEMRYGPVMSDFAREAIKLSYFGSEAHAELAAELSKIFGEKEGTELARVLAAGLDHDKTAEANLRLADVAQGRWSLRQFLEEFGHRGHQEFELAQPRWREQPAFLEAMIANIRAHAGAAPHRLHEAMKRRRQELERSLPDKLRARGTARAAGKLAELCAQVRRYLPYRETAKHYWLLGYELLRQVLLELGRRRGLDGGIFFLYAGELPELVQGRDFSRVIAERRSRRRAELRVYVPDVISTDDLEAIGRPAPTLPFPKLGEGKVGPGEILTGTGVAPGSAIGSAAVLHDPAEAAGLAPGYVLVCPSTDPGWTPLFINAAGLVMERGGVLSHGAVVARDLGLPAVVIKEATRRIKSDEMIRIDGDAGHVHLLKKA